MLSFEFAQLYNIPKTFDLERGGDVRVFILDNHRPLHLANIYSKHSVVVFDDSYDAGEDDAESLPSDGSELSGGNSSSDSEGSSSEGDEGEEDDDMFNEVKKTFIFVCYLLCGFSVALLDNKSCHKWWELARN